MQLYKTATITCDEHTSGVECTETATYREPIDQSTEAQFAYEAAVYFEANGWRRGTLGFCYCPTHNTASRRLETR